MGDHSLRRSCMCRTCRNFFYQYDKPVDPQEQIMSDPTGLRIRIDVRLRPEHIQWLLDQGKHTVTPSQMVEEIVAKAYENERLSRSEQFTKTIPGDDPPYNPICRCGMPWQEAVQDCRHHYPNPPNPAPHDVNGPVVAVNPAWRTSEKAGLERQRRVGGDPGPIKPTPSPFPGSVHHGRNNP